VIDPADVSDLRRRLREAAGGNASGYQPLAIDAIETCALILGCLDVDMLEVLARLGKVSEDTHQLIAAARAFRARMPPRFGE
jgi:hypothetical protein